MLEKKFREDEIYAVENAPTEDAIQHLTGYVASLKQSTKCLTSHRTRDETTSKLVLMAKKMELFRRTKERLLGDELSALGEPVWKILIQLIVAAEEPQNLSVTDISHRISLPKTTTFRYIHILEKKGYISQSEPQTDQSDSRLCLTEHGQSIMHDTLFALNALANGDQMRQTF